MNERVNLFSVPATLAADEESMSLTIAVVALNLNPAEPTIIGIAWLPAFFEQPLDPELRTMIVEHLRHHADKLESGEIDKRMEELRRKH